MSESLTEPMSGSLSLVLRAAAEQTERHPIASLKLREMVLQAVPSVNSKRNYAKALDEVFTLCANRSQGISRPLLMDYRATMIDKGLSPSTIDVRLAAIRKLVSEARRSQDRRGSAVGQAGGERVDDGCSRRRRQVAEVREQGRQAKT